MCSEFFGYNLTDLNEQYSKVQISKDSASCFVKIEQVQLPSGCIPSTTDVMLVLKQNQARPEIYVKPGVKLANGNEPRSTGPVIVLGESWLQFSYQFPWDKQSNSLIQFVESALRRFAMHE